MKFDSPKEMLLVDYEKSLAAVDKFEGILLQIQNWSIVGCGAVTAYGYEKSSSQIMLLASFLAILFGVFAHLYKAFQIDAMNHASLLELLLASPDPIPETYVFGIGHNITGATWFNLRRALMHRALWYLHAFYVILMIMPIAGILFFRSSQ